MTGQHTLKSSDRSRRARASVWTVQWTGMTLELREKHQMLAQQWCCRSADPTPCMGAFPRDKGWKRLWYQWSKSVSPGIVPPSLWSNSLKQISQSPTPDSLNLSCSGHSTGPRALLNQPPTQSSCHTVAAPTAAGTSPTHLGAHSIPLTLCGERNESRVFSRPGSGRERDLYVTCLHACKGVLWCIDRKAVGPFNCECK